MTAEQQIFIVDDDASVRASLSILLQSAAYQVSSFASAREFLEGLVPDGGCLIADMRMPSMSGLELQEEIARAGVHLPVIIVTGHGEVPLAVRAMKAGAIDFIEKPFDNETLLRSVERAVKVGRQLRDRAAETRAARAILAKLTVRERDVLGHLVKGRPNKVVAFELGISPRTVEIHRARIMAKMKSRSLSDLVRIVMAADEPAANPPIARAPEAPVPGAPA